MRRVASRPRRDGWGPGTWGRQRLTHAGPGRHCDREKGERRGRLGAKLEHRPEGNGDCGSRGERLDPFGAVVTAPKRALARQDVPDLFHRAVRHRVGHRACRQFEMGHAPARERKQQADGRAVRRGRVRRCAERLGGEKRIGEEQIRRHGLDFVSAEAGRPRLGEARGGLLRGTMTATLTAEEALDEFRAAGALLEGHFILSSGLHSPVFLQKMFVFQDPARTERLCRALADKAREVFGPIDIVASPAVGGIVPGYETARWLGAKAIFVEREAGRFRLRRGFAIPSGARVLMVEDIITTGLSSRETLEALAEHPGTIVGAACLIDRSGGKAEIGVRRVALATLDIPAYAPDALPAALAALPAVKPGSRALAGAA